MISIVIPAYNLSEYISSCLDSIRSQKFRDFEVIVVNDGSSDSTHQVVEDYIKFHNVKNIRLIDQENCGVTVARYTGVRESMGEWVTFVDGDDLLPVGALLAYSRALLPDVDVVVGSHIREQISGCVWRRVGNFQLEAVDYMRYMLRGNVEGAPWAKVFRRSLLEKKIFDLPREIKNKEDVIMNFRIAAMMNGKASFIDDYVYRYKEGRVGSAYTSFKKKFDLHYWLEIEDYILSSITDVANEYDLRHSIAAHCYRSLCTARLWIPFATNEDFSKVLELYAKVKSFSKFGYENRVVELVKLFLLKTAIRRRKK